MYKLPINSKSVGPISVIVTIVVAKKIKMPTLLFHNLIIKTQIMY